VFGLGLVGAGCSRGAEAPSGGTTPGALSTPASQPASHGQGVAIEFRSEPDPPASGENTFEVVVTQPDGSPVTDATVEVVFSMPAMPAMNMPAMRTTVALPPQGSGRYRGAGQLSMGGTWNVTVTVSRGAEELGRRNLSVIAK
jgi:nitrogen fixation protein FixH